MELLAALKKTTMVLCVHKHGTKIFGRFYSQRPVQMAYSYHEPKQHGMLQPPIVLMHGLFGSKTNWRSLSKQISLKTSRAIYAVDARNHGDSPHTNEIDYHCLSMDLQHFIEEKNLLNVCLIGHSMGGRAVMACALEKPRIVEKLFVLDISPVNSPMDQVDVPDFLKIMIEATIPADLDLTQGRKYMDKKLQLVVEEEGLRQFLLTNLGKSKDGFHWKANVDAIAKNFSNFHQFPYQEPSAFEGTCHFIGGANSSYIRREDHEAVRKIFPNASFDYIKNAGHWLHADNPQDFLKTLIPLINS